ncbi:MAG: DUF354 domain-containing protein [Candidatus Caldarchaeum sp.]
MATVWLDILTPKQFWFFRKVAKLLTKRGYRVVATSRNYEQLSSFLVNPGFEVFHVVGEFGGAGLRGKLVKSVERMRGLLDVLEDFDCAVSSGSPEAARIAYGLSQPHVLASDTPESPVNRLAAPISKKIATPWIVGKHPWKAYGVRDGDIITYRALDPVAWIKDHKPNKQTLDELGLIPMEYVLVRTPEYKASYLIKSGYQLEVFASVVKRTAEMIKPRRLVLLPRYVDEILYLKNRVGDVALVVEKPVTDLTLLSSCLIFVGGGGTMTQEAALLGVPCLSIYPSTPPKVISYLVSKGLVERVKKVEQLPSKLERMLKNIDKLRDVSEKRAGKLLRRMEDPAEKVVATVEAAMSS